MIPNKTVIQTLVQTEMKVGDKGVIHINVNITKYNHDDKTTAMKSMSYMALQPKR
jgi:hypothetical protein